MYFSISSNDVIIVVWSMFSCGFKAKKSFNTIYKNLKKHIKRCCCGKVFPYTSIVGEFNNACSKHRSIISNALNLVSKKTDGHFMFHFPFFVFFTQK